MTSILGVELVSCRFLSTGGHSNSRQGAFSSCKIHGVVNAFSKPTGNCLIRFRRRVSANVSQSSSVATLEGGSSIEMEAIPIPKVIIDLDSDPNATILFLVITFGDGLGTLLDTMGALKGLGLNVVKANVFLDSSDKHNTFGYWGKSSRARIARSNQTDCYNNLLEYNPESSSLLAMGAAFGVMPPKETVDVNIATHIMVQDDGPDRSLLFVETAVRPGLLAEVVKIITDVNVFVESGEFNTEKAKFHVSYQGKAVPKPLQLVMANSLRYFLSRPSTEEASF